MAARAARRLRAVVTLGVAPAVALLAPGPAEALAGLTRAQQPDPTAPLLAAVALLAWGCTGWLLIVIASTAGSRLPGAVGRAARQLAIRLAPASVRGLVRLALGTTIALSAAGTGGAAFADNRPAVSSSFDWPGTASPAADVLDWPSSPPSRVAAPPPSPSGPYLAQPRHPVTRHAAATTAPPTQVPATPAPEPRVQLPVSTASPHLAPRAAVPVPAVPTDLVVVEGDSLWAISAAALGPGATAHQVAQAWPRWWQANRELLGDHPELLHPGDHLHRPAAT